MKLRQRYKRLKQEMEIIKNIRIKPVLVKQDVNILVYKSGLRVELYETENVDLIKHQIVNNMIDEIFKHVSFENYIDPLDCKVVIKGTIKIAD